MDTKKFYENEAKVKEIWGGIREKVLAEQILNIIPDDAQKILDVGCGSGYLLSNIKKVLKKSVFGMDISHVRAVSASKNLNSKLFFEGDVEKFSVKPGKFDLIIISEVLEHIRDYEKTIAELLDKTGKYLLITVPNEQDTRVIECPKCGYAHFLDGHINKFSLGQLLDILKRLDGNRVLAAKQFYTIFTYNRLTLRFPRFLRIFLDNAAIKLAPVFGFLKGNFILILVKKC